MKKVLLLLLLTCSLTIVAQQQKTLNFTACVTENQAAVEKEVRIILDYGNDHKVKIFMNNGVYLYDKQPLVKHGYTESGYEYLLYNLTNTVDQTEMRLQYFYKLDIMRIVFNDDTFIEFFNSEL